LGDRGRDEVDNAPISIRGPSPIRAKTYGSVLGAILTPRIGPLLPMGLGHLLGCAPVFDGTSAGASVMKEMP
jgi:hypothetical protein